MAARTRHGRVYGKAHQELRKRLLPLAYGRPCARCGRLMLPGQRLHLGHTVDLAEDPQSIADRMEHADYRDCPAGGNTSAGGRLSGRRRRLAPSRAW